MLLQSALCMIYTLKVPFTHIILRVQILHALDMHISLSNILPVPENNVRINGVPAEDFLHVKWTLHIFAL